MLTVGAKAPDFTLFNQKNESVHLHDFLGKKVVLYFYPKDHTPGCAKQACAFKAAYQGFQNQDIVVIGISKDSVASHQKFAEKYELPFLLLADPETKVIQAYELWQEKKMYGKTYWGTVRATYIIDETGVIIKVFPKAKPDTNAKEILSYLTQQQTEQPL